MKPPSLRLLLLVCLFGLLSCSQAQREATKDTPFVNSLGMKFVPVPGTKVLFSVWETRVQDLAVFAKETGRDKEAARETDQYWEKPDFQQGPTHPAVKLRWADAAAFCAWLSKKEGRAYRLPTDAEWSVAAGLGVENGNTPKDKETAAGKERNYPWGKVWPPPRATGNFADMSAAKANPGMTFIAGYDDGFAHTSPVGSFAANAFGLYDLAGNAWEWCEDSFQWLDSKELRRNLRGGAWSYGDEFFLRSTCRPEMKPTTPSDDFGFRCVLVVPGG